MEIGDDASCVVYFWLVEKVGRDSAPLFAGDARPKVSDSIPILVIRWQILGRV